MKTDLIINFGTKMSISSIMSEKFQSKQTVNVFKKINTVPKAAKLYIDNNTSVSSTYTFSLAGNIIVYTPNQSTNREQYFNHIYKEKMPTLRELNTSPFISPFIDRVFSIFRQKKVRVQPVRNGHQSGYSRADTINNNINKRSNRFSIRKYLKKCTENK